MTTKQMLLSVLILGATTGLAMEKDPLNRLFSLNKWNTRLNSRSSFLNSLIDKNNTINDDIKIVRCDSKTKGLLHAAFNDYYSIQTEHTYTRESTIKDLKKYLKENLKKLTSETLTTFCEENKEKNPYKNFLHETRLGHAVFCPESQTILYDSAKDCNEYEQLIRKMEFIRKMMNTKKNDEYEKLIRKISN
jgi:hypothetical protein